jgi:hypothetical protein
MPVILGSSLISRAATIAQDSTNVRWPRTELLDWLNDGQREVVLHRPEASVTNASVLLTANSTKQSLPAAAITLIDITRNMGAAGTTPGAAVRLVSREVLDSQRPTWHNDTNSLGVIEHFVFDPRDPRSFYVYPKAPATAWYVEVIYASAPTNTNDAGAVIGVDDVYANALLDFVLYRLYSKDAEYAGNAERALAHYTAFMQSVQGRTKTELERNPNLTASPFDPPLPSGVRR